MNLPYKSLGIELKGYRMTRKQLYAFKNENKPHTVPLFTNGGIFTSKGDGVYESAVLQFNSVDEFWRFARGYKNVVRWRG